MSESDNQVDDLEHTADDAAQIADAVVRIDKAASALLKAGLNQRALEVLIKAQCGVPMHTIRRVLDSLASLREHYTEL